MDILCFIFIVFLSLVVIINIAATFLLVNRVDITKNKWYHFKYLTKDMEKELYRFSNKPPQISVMFRGSCVEIIFLFSDPPSEPYLKYYLAASDDSDFIDIENIRFGIRRGIYDWNRYICSQMNQPKEHDSGIYIVELL